MLSNGRTEYCVSMPCQSLTSSIADAFHVRARWFMLFSLVWNNKKIQRNGAWIQLNLRVVTDKLNRLAVWMMMELSTAYLVYRVRIAVEKRGRLLPNIENPFPHIVGFGFWLRQPSSLLSTSLFARLFFILCVVVCRQMWQTHLCQIHRTLISYMSLVTEGDSILFIDLFFFYFSFLFAFFRSSKFTTTFLLLLLFIVYFVENFTIIGIAINI